MLKCEGKSSKVSGKFSSVLRRKHRRRWFPFSSGLSVSVVIPVLLQAPFSALKCFIPSGKPTLRKAELRKGRTRVFDDVIAPLNQPTLEPALAWDLFSREIINVLFTNKPIWSFCFIAKGILADTSIHHLGIYLPVLSVIGLYSNPI